jgi:hypothetical protein
MQSAPRLYHSTERVEFSQWSGVELELVEYSELLVNKLLFISAVGSQLIQLGSCCEIGDSQRRHEAVNTEVEGCTALEAVIKQRPVKTQQTEKN